MNSDNEKDISITTALENVVQRVQENSSINPRYLRDCPFALLSTRRLVTQRLSNPRSFLGRHYESDGVFIGNFVSA
jgi:hypothetical protein